MTTTGIEKLKNSFLCGEEIEYFDYDIQKWMPANNPSWKRGLYRVKPKDIDTTKKEEKRKFMLLAEKGGNPPKYIHETPASAYWEAIRLCDLLECKVTILEIVGEIECKEKVVIEKTPNPILSENFKNYLESQENNDLPF